MFESDWLSVDGLVPLAADPAPDWDRPDYAQFVDSLAAADSGVGPSLSGVLTLTESSPLSAIDPARLDDDAKLELVSAAHQREARSAAVKARAVAAFAGPTPTDDHSEAAFAWCEISALLTLGEGTARSYTDQTRHLVANLPGTLALALEQGLPWPKVRTIVTATMGLSADQCAQVEARVLDAKTLTRTARAHWDMVDRWVRKVAPDAWRGRREQKLRDTALIRLHHGDGVADVIAENIDSYQADLLWTAADTWARRHKAEGSGRTLDQLRVDALVQFAADYLSGTPTGSDIAPSAKPPTRAGSPATVNVVIPLPELVGGHGEAMLAATGQPLPAEAVADLLVHGAGVRFVLTDEQGDLVGFSPDRHDPDKILQTFLCLRDIAVRTPSGSSAAAEGQDFDHIDPRGPTTARNLHPPSRGWHRAKTFGHWTVTANPDRTITWTSNRTRRSYTTHPFKYRDGP